MVTSTEIVNLKSEVGKEAAKGGILGLAIGALSGGDGRAEGAVIGAAAGSALSAILTKIDEGSGTAISYTLQRRDGSEFKVVSDDKHIRLGDCVAVETGKTTNLRSVSHDMCEYTVEHPAGNELAVKQQKEATECQEAKKQLLRAETDDELDASIKKVRALCQY